MLLLFFCFIPAASFCAADKQGKKPASSWQRRFVGGLGGLLGIGFGYRAMGAVQSYQQGESPSNTTIAAGTGTIAVGGLGLWSWVNTGLFRNAQGEVRKAEAEYKKFSIDSVFEKEKESKLSNAETKEKHAARLENMSAIGINAFEESRTQKAEKIWARLEKTQRSEIEDEVKRMNIQNKETEFNTYELSYFHQLCKEKEKQLKKEELSQAEKNLVAQDFINKNLILECGMLREVREELRFADKKTSPVAKLVVYRVIVPYAAPFVLGLGLGAAARFAGDKETVRVGKKEFSFRYNSPKF